MLNSKRWKTLVAAACGFICFAAGNSAPAQSLSAADAAAYTGADRQQRLLEGAKKEGELTLYTSLPVEDMTVLKDAFEKKYGVKIKIWRSGSENILQRTVTEARGNRFDADVIETSGPELESLHREHLLQAVASPVLATLLPSAILPHREWISTRLNVYTFAYNTKLVKQEDLPKSYQDLLDPKWKGKLGIEADDADWFASIVTELGEAKGLKLFRDIVSANGLSVRKGHSLLMNLVASGEVPLALDVYNYKAEQMKLQGAPVDWFAIAPAMAAPQGIGVLKHSPHPNAAILFFDFMLSEAQPILLKRNYVPTSKSVDTNLNKMPIKFIDTKIKLDEAKKWNKLYEEIVMKQSR